MLLDEAVAIGFVDAETTPGGVLASGDWPEVWRANLNLRGASHVLIRIGAFRASHLSQLDKSARKAPWGDILRRDQPVRVEANCKRSKLYHSGAVAERVAKAIQEKLGAPIAADAPLRVLVRIDRNLCEISVDSSGDPLHKRGFKQAVGKAPLRETLAAPLLRRCGYDGREPVLDPMCGSGALVIEAAEIAKGLAPGRSRSFAFERLAGFDPSIWSDMRAAVTPREVGAQFYGYDRDAGAIANSQANASRADVQDLIRFRTQPISVLTAPEGPAGLVMVNPPYGGRIGDIRKLRALYGTLGSVLRERFAGWRVGVISSEATLARATRLPFSSTSAPIPHGSFRLRLYATQPLA